MSTHIYHRLIFVHNIFQTLDFPELVLMEVVNSDPQPTLRGKMLTLVCAAKGSKNLKFQWYKDSVLVNTSLTQRNAWESIIPQTAHGSMLSVLNIDVAVPIDQGKLILKLVHSLWSVRFHFILTCRVINYVCISQQACLLDMTQICDTLPDWLKQQLMLLTQICDTLPDLLKQLLMLLTQICDSLPD